MTDDRVTAATVPVSSHEFPEPQGVPVPDGSPPFRGEREPTPTAPNEDPTGTGNREPATTLRPYQVAAVDSVRERYVAGDRRTLVVLATGLGKTRIAAELFRRAVNHSGKPCLFVAHRRELLTQARAEFEAFGLDAQIEQAGARARRDAHVVVASVQTLKGARLERWLRDHFGLIGIDEAHHATAVGYQAVLERFAGKLGEPLHAGAAHVFGLTATPDRLDGAALGKVFQSVAYRYEIREGIRGGYLAPIRALRVQLESVDLDGVRVTAGDFQQGQLSGAMTSEAALHGVCKPLLDLAGDRPTLLFAVDVAHAHALAEVLNGYRPGCARAIDGSAPADLRSRTVRDFKAGAFQFLVNVALYTEGFNAPKTACVALARPTKSRGLATQCIGRGTRTAPGKTDCLVLHFTAATSKHRLVGPADVLAGRELPADELGMLEAILDGDPQLALDDALDLAAAGSEEARARAKVLAVAKYQAEEVDPFLGAELAQIPRSATWGVESATAAQRLELAKAGLDDLPEALSRDDAYRILAAVERRKAAGLCSVKQARRLKHIGVGAGFARFRFDDASRVMAMLRERGPRAAVNLAFEIRRARERRTA